MDARLFSRPLRVIAFQRDQSAYTWMFYVALEALDVQVVSGFFAGGWLWKNVRRGDVVHIHWPSFDYRAATRAATLKAFIRWNFLLLMMRAKGARIVWSGHNVLPHDPSLLPFVDVLARHVVIFHSRHVFVHGVHAGRKLAERFPAVAGKMVVIPHGHWIGHYPVGQSRAAARAALGVTGDATFVYLFIGACKPYKNLEALIDAFARIAGDARLLIVGGFPKDGRYLSAIRARAAADARVAIVPGYVENDRMNDYLVAGDAIVAPYRESLTSGTAVLAMSAGRPVVSIATGHLLDVVTRDTGVLYDAADADGLRDALETVRSRRYDEERIVRHARQFTFEEAAEITVATLTGVSREAVRGGGPPASFARGTPPGVDASLRKVTP